MICLDEIIHSRLMNDPEPASPRDNNTCPSWLHCLPLVTTSLTSQGNNIATREYLVFACEKKSIPENAYDSLLSTKGYLVLLVNATGQHKSKGSYDEVTQKVSIRPSDGRVHSCSDHDSFLLFGSFPVWQCSHVSLYTFSCISKGSTKSNRWDESLHGIKGG